MAGLVQATRFGEAFAKPEGRSEFETAGIAGYGEEFKSTKTPLWAKRCYLVPIHG